MSNGIAFASTGLTGAGKILSEKEVMIGLDGFFKYKLFGHEFYLTTTHIGILIVMLALIIFAVVAGRAVKKSDPTKTPGAFVNVIEKIVEALDNLTLTNMGEEHGGGFANYIGTLFGFIFLSNIGGLFGLRSPTADYGVTFSLALITFFMIHYNGFKHQKFGHIKGLFEPVFIFFPINVISEIATPISMSLRLFGNILAGTAMMALIYGLLPRVLTFFWPSVLHAYFDLFSGAIQSYVFCMLTMVFVAKSYNEE